MINSADQTGGGVKIEVIPGMYYIPDFENPQHHDGSLAHYRDFRAIGAELGVLKRDAGRAFLQTYAHAVHVADQDQFAFRSIAARSLDWRFNTRSSAPIEIQKRLRIFLTNDLVANTFYDSIVPTSSQWPSQYLDVIEALLRSRGYDRESEKRAAHLARRAELS